MKCFVLVLALLSLHIHVRAQEQEIGANKADTCFQLPERSFIIRAILIEGNNRTKDYIIFREIEFAAGDTLSFTHYCRVMRKSRQNLLNLGLFNFVEFDTLNEGLQDGYKDVLVRVTERWYVWPFPIFELAERNVNSWWELKDFRRVNYGVFVTINNFRGRMELLRILARAGYNQNYFITYEVPYLNKKQTLGAIVETGILQSRETNYQTEGNKYRFFRPESGIAQRQSYGRLIMVYRPAIHNQHFFSLGFENFQFADTLLRLNPKIGFNEKSDYQYFKLAYKFKHDYRDARAYPLNGHYLEINAEQRGLGILANEPANQIIKATFDLYRPISKQWHYAFTTTFKTVIGKCEPYHLRQGLGFNNDFVRGYELYVIDGKHFALFKSNIKYTLLSPRTKQLPFPVTERFSKIHYALYLNALFDAAYVHENPPSPVNPLQNRMLFGTGLGLDLVTYYDLVCRFEYSINHMGQRGLYLHFVAPI